MRDFSPKHMSEKELYADWIYDFTKSKNPEEEFLIKLKNQIIEKYNVERSVAAQIAVDLLEAMNFLDVDSELVQEYVLK